jgi:hypothetical protein
MNNSNYIQSVGCFSQQQMQVVAISSDEIDEHFRLKNEESECENKLHFPEKRQNSS